MKIRKNLKIHLDLENKEMIKEGKINPLNLT
jgi:hypothetical protein